MFLYALYMLLYVFIHVFKYFYMFYTCFKHIFVYDNRGRFVNELLNQKVPVGYNTIQWNALNLASGVYFLQFQLGSLIQTQKVVLVK